MTANASAKNNIRPIRHRFVDDAPLGYHLRPRRVTVVISELMGLLVLLAIAAILAVLLMTALLVYNVRHPPRHTAGTALARGRPCDPDDVGLSFEEWSLDRPGARLPVWEAEIPVDRRQERGPSDEPITAIFVHGWGQSRISMLNRIEPFDASCERLVMYDLRGHGEATGVRTPLGWREEEDLLALLDRLGDGRFLFVGNSMGAVIALQAAARHDGAAGRVVGVVAYGLYTDSHRSVRGRLRLRNLPRRPMTDLAMAWFRLNGLRFPAVEAAAGSIRCPLLLVHGSDDEVAPLEHARRVTDAAIDAELIVIAGGTHLDAHEVDPERHDAAVRQFIDRLA